MTPSSTTRPRTTRRRKTVTPRIVLALVIIAVGVIFTLDNLGVVDSGDIFAFWPLALVALGVVRLLSAGRYGLSGLIWIAAGVIFLLPRIWRGFDLGEWFEDYWSLLLIAFGVYLVLSSLISRRAPTGGGVTSPRDDSEIDAFAFLGSFKRASTSDDFRGGDLVAVMGGCEIDLREATIAQGTATIEVVAVWGGIELRVPPSWSVDLQVLPVMGGAEDKTAPPSVPGGERLEVRGFAVMGGVEITN